MTTIDRLESAIALEELRPLTMSVITACTFGSADWRDPMFATCRNVAALEGTGGTLLEDRRPICVSHALVIAQRWTTAHTSACAAPTSPGRCCTETVSAMRACPAHGMPAGIPIGALLA